MNWKGFGRKRSWSNLRFFSQHSPGGTEEDYEKSQSGYPSSGRRFEARTFRMSDKMYCRGKLTIYNPIVIRVNLLKIITIVLVISE
jgi:hypothetical protein